MFELDKIQYLVMVDYHSKFLVVHKLTSTTSAMTANMVTATFGLLGAPTEISDNVCWRTCSSASNGESPRRRSYLGILSRMDLLRELYKR